MNGVKLAEGEGALKVIPSIRGLGGLIDIWLKLTGKHDLVNRAWEWFRTDDTLMRTGQFDRGAQTGVWRTFDRSGRVVKETDFTKRSST